MHTVHDVSDRDSRRARDADAAVDEADFIFEARGLCVSKKIILISSECELDFL